MIWRAPGRLGHLSYKVTNAMEAGPCAVPLGPAGRDSLRWDPVTLWACQRNAPCGTVPAVFHISIPGLTCTDEHANELLEDFGSLFK